MGCQFGNRLRHVIESAGLHHVVELRGSHPLNGTMVRSSLVGKQSRHLKEELSGTDRLEGLYIPFWGGEFSGPIFG